MISIRKPILHPVAIDDLRPTQITVGMREVEATRKAWSAKEGDKGAEFRGRHLLPVILGPKRRYYVIDHHHLARALHEQAVFDPLCQSRYPLSHGRDPPGATQSISLSVTAESLPSSPAATSY
jgi:hypothetical protein